MLNRLRLGWAVLVIVSLLELPCAGLLAADAQMEEPSVQICPRPAMTYSLASPRACLIGPPIWATNNRSLYYMPTGAAENFPRANGSIKVPLGTKVVFRLSRGLEGVWYTHSYGLLGTSLELQWCRWCKCRDCTCEEYDCEKCESVDGKCTDDALRLCPWVTIGKDGARDVRRGPSIGRAKVGIPILFRKPGIYYLRGIVRTTAQPWYPRPLEVWHERLVDDVQADAAMEIDAERILPHIPAAVDEDIVYVRVHVVDMPIIHVEPVKDTAVDPDAANITPMPKEIDPNDPDQLSADINGDALVNLADFAIMAQQWGRELEIPYADDE